MQMNTANNHHIVIYHLKPSSIDKCQYTDKTYPFDASFRFLGFSGKNDAENIIQAIKKATDWRIYASMCTHL